MRRRKSKPHKIEWIGVQTSRTDSVNIRNRGERGWEKLQWGAVDTYETLTFEKTTVVFHRWHVLIAVRAANCVTAAAVFSRKSNASLECSWRQPNDIYSIAVLSARFHLFLAFLDRSREPEIEIWSYDGKIKINHVNVSEVNNPTRQTVHVELRR